MIVAVFSYFVLINHSVGYDDPGWWMQTIPFIWLFGFFGGYFLYFLSSFAFVIEHSQRHLWAKVLIKIVALIFVILCILGGYMFILGIKSLKSG